LGASGSVEWKTYHKVKRGLYMYQLWNSSWTSGSAQEFDKEKIKQEKKKTSK
jgi:hypothetical protein